MKLLVSPRKVYPIRDHLEWFDEDTAKCWLCSSVLKANHGNTSTHWKHLRARHDKVHQEMTEKQKRNKFPNIRLRGHSGGGGAISKEAVQNPNLSMKMWVFCQVFSDCLSVLEVDCRRSFSLLEVCVFLFVFLFCVQV